MCSGRPVLSSDCLLHCIADARTNRLRPVEASSCQWWLGKARWQVADDGGVPHLPGSLGSAARPCISTRRSWRKRTGRAHHRRIVLPGPRNVPNQRSQYGGPGSSPHQSATIRTAGQNDRSQGVLRRQGVTSSPVPSAAVPNTAVFGTLRPSGTNPCFFNRALWSDGHPFLERASTPRVLSFQWSNW